MIKIFIIADDITGSLDSAVMLSKQGIKTEVFKYDKFNKEAVSSDTGAVVIDTGSRHLAAQEARTRVRTIAEIASDMDVQIIYKKTDSALRGNVGSELAAVLDVYKDRSLVFLPAFPKMKRNTIEGIHYIEGVPVAESVFGDDPLDPVKTSSVTEIINEQAEKLCISIGKSTVLTDSITSSGAILIVDCETEEDFIKRSVELAAMRKPLLLAGCAGFAYYLAELTEVASKNLIVSGSFNEITLRQIDKAASMGWPVFILPMAEGWNDIFAFAQKIREALDEKGCAILCTGRKKAEIPSKEICSRLGRITAEVLSGGMDASLTIFGGDTLDAVLGELGCEKIIPIKEIETGIPISTAYCREKEITLISKSGGFGSEDTAVNIIRRSLCLKEK